MKKQLMILTIVLAIGIGFSGCGAQNQANPNTMGAYLTKVKPATDKQVKIKKFPDLNTINTVDIGSNMYEKFNIITTGLNEIILEDTARGIYTIAWSKLSCNFPKNIKYNEYVWKNKFIAINGGATCYSLTREDYSYSSWATLIDQNNSGYFTHIAMYPVSDTMDVLPNKFKYSIKPEIIVNQDSFKYIALYQGKIGDKIKISYREFKDNMARPAFTQDIEYELEKDKPTIIGFKGLRIEVLEATNLDIKYKVIKDYN